MRGVRKAGGCIVGPAELVVGTGRMPSPRETPPGIPRGARRVPVVALLLLLLLAEVDTMEDAPSPAIRDKKQIT